MTQIVVIAKEPVAGRVKTRLTPPFTPGQAARLAAAALEDTLRAVAAAPVRHRVLALDGLPGTWLPGGPESFVVIAQRGDGLDERLAAAFADAYRLHREPVVLIGMDTPTSHRTCCGLRAPRWPTTTRSTARRPTAASGCWACAVPIRRSCSACPCPGPTPAPPSCGACGRPG
nr:hypothetical protein GCM10020093_110470 [Planobispora longispora]